MRLEIHVLPNAARTFVGGSHGGLLVVRVAEPADEGRATKAALRAVAHALGVRAGAVSLVRGATSRQKLLEVDVPGPAQARLEESLDRLRRAEQVPAHEP